MFVGWHIAAFSRTKRMPNLQHVLGRLHGRPQQTWQQQLAQVKAITAMFGGVDRTEATT